MVDAKKWLESVYKFLEAWRVVRICPREMTAPQEQLSLNILTLAVSLGILLLARAGVAGTDKSIAANLLATLISVSIVFVTGYVALIFVPGDKGMEAARKWGIFFIMMWLTSLLFLLLIDAIPFWLGAKPITSVIIDATFGRGRVEPWIKDALRGAFFGAIALAILLYKSRSGKLLSRMSHL